MNKFPPDFLSNIPKKDKTKILKASKDSGIKIYIKSPASDAYGMPLKDAVAVYSADVTQEHSKLWIKYNEMECC